MLLLQYLHFFKKCIVEPHSSQGIGLGKSASDWHPLKCNGEKKWTPKMYSRYTTVKKYLPQEYQTLTSSRGPRNIILQATKWPPLWAKHFWGSDFEFHSMTALSRVKKKESCLRPGKTSSNWDISFFRLMHINGLKGVLHLTVRSAVVIYDAPPDENRF